MKIFSFQIADLCSPDFRFMKMWCTSVISATLKLLSPACDSLLCGLRNKVINSALCNVLIGFIPQLKIFTKSMIWVWINL